MLKNPCSQFSSSGLRSALPCDKQADPSHAASLPEPLLRVTMHSQSVTSRAPTIFILLRQSTHRASGYFTIFHHCRQFFNSERMCLFLCPPNDSLIMVCPFFISSLRFLKKRICMSVSPCLGELSELSKPGR